MKSRGISICKSSVYNYLKFSNLKYKNPLKRILINDVNKNKRFIWALEHKEFNWNNNILQIKSHSFFMNQKVLVRDIKIKEILN